MARRAALARLHRPWFAGGTITVASVQADKYYLADGHQAFEDGTVDYLNIPAVEIGLKHLESIGYPVIHERVRCLTGWLLDNLTQMKHSTGVPLVRVYGPITTERRGGAVTVNFVDSSGNRHRSPRRSRARPARATSRCAPAASAIRARARSPWASHASSWMCASRSPGTRAAFRWTTSACASTARTAARCASRLGWSRNFADVQAFLSFCRDPAGSRVRSCSRPPCTKSRARKFRIAHTLLGSHRLFGILAPATWRESGRGRACGVTPDIHEW